MERWKVGWLVGVPILFAPEAWHRKAAQRLVRSRAQNRLIIGPHILRAAQIACKGHKCRCHIEDTDKLKRWAVLPRKGAWVNSFRHISISNQFAIHLPSLFVLLVFYSSVLGNQVGITSSFLIRLYSIHLRLDKRLVTMLHPYVLWLGG